jgi:hypothetical protein
MTLVIEECFNWYNDSIAINALLNGIEISCDIFAATGKNNSFNWNETELMVNNA